MAETPPLQGQTSSTATASRGLACALCQHRKVKCDRLLPCNNCTRRNETCVPGVAVPPRQRRRRFAEKELLDRLRHYEALMRENNIKFEPMHKDHPDKKPSNAYSPGSDKSPNDKDDPEGLSPRPIFEAKTYWRILHEKPLDGADDDESDSGSETKPFDKQIQDVWQDVHNRNGYLLPFGRPTVPIDLSSRHPDQVTIFKLWQIYLDNVNPLLKVTHIPTLQPRIITAGSNVATIKPALNALMFSIYCIAIVTLDEDECNRFFGSTKQALLLDYQLCCQQALSNCGILCTQDREALTALFLYLYSISHNMDPHSVNSLLGITVRVAQRMQIHSEHSYLRQPTLEAELRRRLWWAIVLFDTRVGELAGCVTTSVPTWDCHVPLNVNDFELSQDMQSSPQPSGMMSEAVFAAVRSELADLMRHSSYHLDFVNPAYKMIGKHSARVSANEGEEVIAHAKDLEERYLSKCNPEISVQYMALWTTRQFIAKAKMMEHYAQIAMSAKGPQDQTDAQRDAASNIAMTLMECDNKLWQNPLVKNFRWYLGLYMPVPAHFAVLLDLKKRPHTSFAEKAWRILGDNYDGREMFNQKEHQRMWQMYSKIAYQAWHSCEEYAVRQNKSLPVPQLITRLRMQAEEFRQGQAAPRMADDIAKMTFDDSWNTAQIIADLDPQAYDHQTLNGLDMSLDVDMNPPTLLGINLESFDWDVNDWNPYQLRGITG